MIPPDNELSIEKEDLNESFLAARYLQKHGVDVVVEINKIPIKGMAGHGVKGFKVDFSKYKDKKYMFGVVGGDGLVSFDIDKFNKDGTPKDPWTEEDKRAEAKILALPGTIHQRIKGYILAISKL